MPLFRIIHQAFSIRVLLIRKQRHRESGIARDCGLQTYQFKLKIYAGDTARKPLKSLCTNHVVTHSYNSANVMISFIKLYTLKSGVA